MLYPCTPCVRALCAFLPCRIYSGLVRRLARTLHLHICSANNGSEPEYFLPFLASCAIQETHSRLAEDTDRWYTWSSNICLSAWALLASMISEDPQENTCQMNFLKRNNTVKAKTTNILLVKSFRTPSFQFLLKLLTYPLYKGSVGPNCFFLSLVPSVVLLKEKIFQRKPCPLSNSEAVSTVLNVTIKSLMSSFIWTSRTSKTKKPTKGQNVCCKSSLKIELLSTKIPTSNFFFFRLNGWHHIRCTFWLKSVRGKC